MIAYCTVDITDRLYTRYAASIARNNDATVGPTEEQLSNSTRIPTFSVEES